jgi:hypothetical protein
MWWAMKLARGLKTVRSEPRCLISLSWLVSMVSRISSSLILRSAGEGARVGSFRLRGGGVHAVGALQRGGAGLGQEVQQRLCRFRLGTACADGAGEGGDDLQPGRHAAEQRQARQALQFAELLDADLRLAGDDQLAHGHARPGLDEAAFQRVGQAPALEDLQQRAAAGAGGVADAACGQQAGAQCGFRTDIGPRRALAHGDGHARIRHRPRCLHEALRRQRGERVVGQHDDVEDLARLHALRRVDTADGLQPHGGAAGLLVRPCERGQQRLGGHGRQQRDLGVGHGGGGE